jgi:hypothetical protein
LRYIFNIYIYFIKNKNRIVSWYYNTILRYNTADKKMILPSIPIPWLYQPESGVTSSLQYFTSSCHILQNQIMLLQLTICSIYHLLVVSVLCPRVQSSPHHQCKGQVVGAWRIVLHFPIKPQIESVKVIPTSNIDQYATL